MAFCVIDLKTMQYPNIEKIARTEGWANNLVPWDMDGFCVDEDGKALMIDKRGNYARCPADRFKVIYSKEG